MHDVALLNVGQDTKAALRWNQTANDFLGDIFGRRTQKILKLDRAEFLNNGGLLLNTVLESGLKLVELALLLVEVLDEAAPALLHLVEATL